MPPLGQQLLKMVKTPQAPVGVTQLTYCVTRTDPDKSLVPRATLIDNKR
jgi:hypothetical protein